MSTTIDHDAELTRLREHNRLLSDTITAMQHEIDAHHVIAQSEYKELVELRALVKATKRLAGHISVGNHNAAWIAAKQLDTLLADYEGREDADS